MKSQAFKYGIKDHSLVFINQANLGLIGEKKFIVHAGWWRKWCDFANFGETMELNNTNYESTAKVDDEEEESQKNPAALMNAVK